MLIHGVRWIQNIINITLKTLRNCKQNSEDKCSKHISRTLGNSINFSYKSHLPRPTQRHNAGIQHTLQQIHPSPLHPTASQQVHLRAGRQWTYRVPSIANCKKISRAHIFVEHSRHGFSFSPETSHYASLLGCRYQIIEGNDVSPCSSGCN